jgi:hypothetical protein
MDHVPVERDGAGTAGLGRQACFSCAGGGVTRAPHEQTMLRVAHWMFSRRPHWAHPM